MTKDKAPKDRLSKLTERILSELDNTPEESVRYKADREAALGTTHEWAQMQEDGSIAVNISQWLPDGTYGHGFSTSVSGDPDYEELRASHALKKPGDASTIIKKWVDGQWVVQQDDSDTNTQDRQTA
jgi:hypothetical protein